jgi:flagellar motor switch protein FliN/FliY
MPAGIESILALEVPVIVQIGERLMAVEDVLSMAPGSIIELPKPSNGDLEILVNNKVIGTGSAVKVGENFGVRVGYIGDLRRRLSAMRGPKAPDGSVPPDVDDPPDEGPGPGH